MEEVAIAGQMKEIKEALNNWIEANYQEKAKTFSAAGNTDTSFAVSAADLAPYLPATYLNGSNFRGNKLIDGFDVGVRAQCTEVSKDDGSECSVANGCYSLTNGAIAAIPAGAKCSRYKMTGVVLSKAEGNAEIDDRRASRIASMIGADGGYMRTTKLVQSLYNGDENEMKKIVGSQGMWEGDVTSYIPGIATNVGGKVAATTIFSSGFSGDYLYRKKVDGLPGANSMFTDLDMGGATECEGDGCHKINNAGGLEVVGGKILIRSQNTDDDQGISSGNSFAKIALATDNSHLHVSDSLNFSVGASISGNSVSDASGQIQMSQYNGISIETKGNMFISGNHFETHVNDGAYAEQYIRGDQTKISVGNNSAFSFLSSDKAKTSVDNGASFSLLTKNTADLSINNEESYLAMDSTGVTIDTLKNAQIAANELLEIQSGFDMKLTAGKNIDQVAGNFARIHSTLGTNITSESDVIISSQDNHLSGYNGKFGALRISRHKFMLQTPSVSINTDRGGLDLGVDTSSGTNTGKNASMASLGIGMASGVFIRNNEVFGALNKSHDTSKIGASFVLNESGFSVSFPKTGLVAANNSDKNYVAYLASVYSNRAKLSVDADTGSTTGNNSIAATNARVSITTTADTGSGITPYYTHGGDTEYDHFRVDPSYMSVMNDIKITSRGGARLSEALPNYILKGIYELFNSYGSGPWPCGNGNCSFTVPYYTRKALGLSSGGWEFNCGGTGTNGSGSHPIVNGGGTCTGKDGNSAYSTGDVVTFNYEKSSYTECSSGSFCWAHPFMGMVPAPGRWVQYNVTGKGREILYAQDEGVCPDGYDSYPDRL